VSAARTALVLALAAAAAAHATDEPAAFSVDYVVRISRRDPTRAHVRWLLAGIDEIESFRLVFRDDRTTDVAGTGRLVWDGRRLRWTPGRPYAHLHYTVRIDRPRGPGDQRDSHAAADWIATRAVHLFPEINVDFRPGATHGRSRARLLFRLPRGWRSATALPPLGGDAWRVEEPGKRFDRPRGWFLLGRFARHARTIAGATVAVGVAPGSALDAARLFRLYRGVMPCLADVLGPPPARLFVVSAPDPMWHGGLSGEDSFFVNGHIPLRSADRTSTYVHELVHVWQPFRPAPDARWVSEGLAEWYALVLQSRAGLLSARGRARGVASFARSARWQQDLTRTRDPRVLNNTAPLVMEALDGEIRAASGGRRTLDDAVRTLAAERGTLTTARFLRAASRAAGRDLTPFFRHHVLRGQPLRIAAGH
jgi:predicted metalloprotease with PDZ domain